MDNVSQLQKLYVDFLTSLFREALLDDQFSELKKIQSETEPIFLNDIFNQYFETSEKILEKFDIAIKQRHVDNELTEIVHQFKGSSASIGVPRVASVCVAFKNCYEADNFEGCLRCLEHAKEEYCYAKDKLETLFTLQEKIIAAGESIPTMG